jgi:alpha-methylacyl-CoA racemase
MRRRSSKEVLAMAGPLSGIRVIEVAGIGPGPFCAMVLADLGAEVVRIDRSAAVRPGPADERARYDVLARGRRSIGLDLKHPEGVAALLRMVEKADVLTEGFRPGVMERLGVGPEPCLARNPRLVYGRMTGFGQEGPLAQAAGHDINYIALAGVLAHIGRKGEAPLPPLNLVGDFGGGGMLLALGVCAALVERASSGKGQVVDAAMVDGAALLMAFIHGFYSLGGWGERGTNLLDTGAHFYETYETQDGKYVSVGSIEPQFYAELVRLSGLESEPLPAQMDRSQWPALKARLAAIFKSKTRDEWCRIMEGTDVCFAPVLTIPEAYAHPHNRARGTFVKVAGIEQPGPAPRFSRTPCEIERPPPAAGEHTDEALGAWGFSREEVRKLREAKAVA